MLSGVSAKDQPTPPEVSPTQSITQPNPQNSDDPPASPNPSPGENTEQNANPDSNQPTQPNHNLETLSSVLIGTWTARHPKSGEVITYIFTQENLLYIIQNSPLGKIATVYHYEVLVTEATTQLKLTSDAFGNQTVEVFQKSQYSLWFNFSGRGAINDKLLPLNTIRLNQQSTDTGLPAETEILNPPTRTNR